MGAMPPQLDARPWPRELPEFIVAPRPTRQTDSAAASSPVLGPVSSSRHNSPDLAAQLQYAARRTIDAIVCSVLDDDPHVRLCAAFAAREHERVIRGINRLRDQTGTQRACIALEADAPRPWDKALRAAANAAGIGVVELPNHYPQADPAILIYALADRPLRPGQLPVEAGILLLDAPAAAVAGDPPGEINPLPVGLLDHASKQVVYLLAHADSTLGDALQAAGISAENKSIFAGDWRRKRPASSDQQPLNSGELTFHLFPQTAAPAPQPCIRCGWCLDVCPTQVWPALALEAAQRGDAKIAARANASACIECGLCDQICPSDLPLLQGVRIAQEINYC
ncbi:MAG: 4Fe-4S dicluster domain-containing protein [Tepidisphaeraceae bacterium]